MNDDLNFCKCCERTSEQTELREVLVGDTPENAEKALLCSDMECRDIMWAEACGWWSTTEIETAKVSVKKRLNPHAR